MHLFMKFLHNFLHHFENGAAGMLMKTYIVTLFYRVVFSKIRFMPSMESRVLIPWSWTDIWAHLESFSPHYVLFQLRSTLILSLHLCLQLPDTSCLSGFQNQIFKKYLSQQW